MRNTKIPWCDETFNPITGCRHGCGYCYARKIAERFKAKGELIEPETFRLSDGLIECNIQPHTIKNGMISKQAYPYGFEPCFNRYRLKEFVEKKHQKNIFVGSMADVFGEWVPDRWIIEIIETLRKFPQYNYLFLTKNPQRYVELNNAGILPTDENFWYGTTVTKADDPFMFGYPYKKFVSIEPLLEDLGECRGALFAEWIIIGAETGNRKGKIIPERSWIENIVRQCRDRNIPVFMKESLKDIWGGNLIQEYPEPLRRERENESIEKG